MGRGLFYLLAGAAAAWSLYLHFVDDKQERPPPPSTPRSPSPSRRRDDRQSTSSRVDRPPLGTSTSLGRPRSPSPHRLSPRRDEQQANDPPVKTSHPQSPFPDYTHRYRLSTLDSSEDPPLITHTLLNRTRLPLPHIPSRQRDDWQPPVETYYPQSPSLDSLYTHCDCCRIDDSGTFDSSWEDDPPNTYASLDHCRSPSPHIPNHRHDDWQAAVETYYPQSPSLDSPYTYSGCCQTDDSRTSDSSWEDYPPVKAYSSLSHCRSPSRHIPTHRHDDWQGDDTPAEIDHPQSPSPPLTYTVDNLQTLVSSWVEDSLATTHASLRHSRSPSPHIPSHRRDDQQNVEVDCHPAETPASLRAMAKKEGDLRSKCYQKSKKCERHRNHALAQAYATQAERHAHTRDSLNARASAIIFKENNKDRSAGKIDLHGLSVKEAISYTEIAIKDACLRGDSEICLIVGQGTHSDGGVSRLKPAIISAMRKRGHRAREYRNNPGRLRVVI